MDLVGSEIYLLGGGKNRGFTDQFYSIDLKSKKIDLIESKGSVPEGRSFHKTAVFGNILIVFGGLNFNTVFRDYHTFNTSTH